MPVNKAVFIIEETEIVLIIEIFYFDLKRSVLWTLMSHL